VKFYKAVSFSTNVAVRVCARLVLEGSGSAVSNSLSFVAEAFRLSRDNVASVPKSSLKCSFDVHDCIIGRAIRELCDMKFIFNNCFFTRNELNTLIIHLCTTYDD
jgi:hypothetical protein